MMIKGIVSTGIAFLLNFSTFGQANLVEKMEIPLQLEENPFTVVPAAENGFVLLREKYLDSNENKKFWEVFLHNTNMKLSWNAVIEAEYMFGLFGQTYSENKLFLLFVGIKNLKKQLYIHQIDLINRSDKKIPIETYLPDHVSYFSSFNNSLIIGGREQGKNSFIFFNPENKNPTILPGIFKNRSDILDINQDNINQLFTMIVTYVNNKRQNALNLRSFDPNGSPVENIRIDPEDDVEFMNAKALIINSDLRIIAGTYKNRKSSDPFGLFLYSIRLNGNKKIKYFTLKEAFQFQDSLTEQDSKYKSEQLTHYLKEDSWNVSKIYDTGKENVVILEAFNNQKYYANTGDLKKIFVHDLGLIVGFNDQLEITWVNDFSLMNTVSNEFSYYINLSQNKGQLKLYSFYLNRIIEKIIVGPRTIKPEHPITLVQAEYRKDLPISYSNDLSGFQDWYGDFSLFSGVKSFENVESNPIFFVYKVEYK